MSQESGKKLSLPIRLIIGVIGVVAMVSGIRQCGSGLDEMSAGSAVEKLVTVIDAHVDSGNVAMIAAQPLMMTLLNDVDKLGLAAARQQDSTEARKAHDLFAQSSAHFRTAAKLTGDVSAKDDRETMKPIWALKMTTFNGLGDVEAINQQITALLRDESATDAKMVTDSILSSAHRRDSVQLMALNAQTQAAAAVAAAKK
jgi:hypothetical protein